MIIVHVINEVLPVFPCIIQVILPVLTGLFAVGLAVI